MLVPVTQREDMDSGAMARRAHERGEQLEKFDPYRLIEEVKGLLEAHGLHPELPAGTGRLSMATGASGKLLRAFGILPVGGPCAPSSTLDGSSPS